MPERTCPQCGTTASEKLKFCRECGGRLDEAAEAPAPAVNSGDATMIAGAGLRRPAPAPVPAGEEVERTVIGSLASIEAPRVDTGTQAFTGTPTAEDSGDRTIMAGLPAAPGRSPPPRVPDVNTATFVGTSLAAMPPTSPPPAPAPVSPEMEPAGETADPGEEPVSQDIDLDDDESGATLAAPSLPPPAPPPPPPAAPRGGALRLEHWSPGSKPQAIAFDKPETVLGRDRGDLRYPNDAYLSKKHARFYRDDQGRPCVEDLGTLNGTFLRIRAPVKLEHRDVVSLGRHVFRFELLKYEEKDDRTIEGDPLTRVQGVQGTSPRARFVKRQEEGFSGMPFFFGSSRYVLGRNEGTHVFQKDDRMSRRHAGLSFREGDFWLEDLGSQNGTFLRLRGPHVLLQGDVLRMGDQYYKVL